MPLVAGALVVWATLAPTPESADPEAEAGGAETSTVGVEAGAAGDESPADEEAEEADEEVDEADDTTGTRTIRVPRYRGDEMTASSRTIDRHIIDTTPKRSSEDLLRLVPGLHIVQHGSQGKGYQFYVRGFDAVHGSDVETLVDDIPVNEGSNVHAHGYLDLAHVIPEVVDSVEADKGSFRLRQGNFGTAASIRYRLGVRERGTRASYEVGSTNRHRVALVHAPRKRGEETFLAVEALSDDGFGERRNARRLSAMGQAEVFSRRGTSLEVFGSAYGARFGLPGVVRIDDVNRDAIGLYDAYANDMHGESGRAVGGLRTKIERDKARATVTGYGQMRRLELDENFTGDLVFPDQGDRHVQNHDAISAGARTDFEIDVHPRIRLLGVGHWQTDAIDQRVDQLTSEGAVWGTTRDLDIVQTTFGAGPGLRALATQWLTLEGGVRFDVFNYQVRDQLQDGQRFDGTLWAASPRFLARFSPLPKWQLFTGYGRGFRSAEARAFTLPDTPPADTDLSQFAGGRPRMTLTDAVEVGSRVQAFDLLDIGVTGFGTWIERESIFDHVSGFNVELSGTQRLGVETDVQIHPVDWADVGMDFTYVSSNFVDSGNPIPGAPTILASAFGSLAHPKGPRAGLRWFVLGPRDLAYGARAGAATVLDVNVGWRFEDYLQIDLSLDNVTNSRWREGEYHFASHWDPNRARSQIPTIHAVAGNPFVARVAVTGRF